MILEYYLPKGVAVTLAYPAYDGEWSSQYVTAPAGLDSEISKDKGNYADCTNEWTEIQTSGTGTIDLTATEMNADIVIVKTTSSTTGVNFPLIVIHTYTAIAANVTQIEGGDATDAIETAVGAALSTYGASTASDVTTAHSTTDGLITTVDGVVDTIQTTTDKLDDTLELDTDVYRFTQNALEQAPTGSSTDIANAVWNAEIASHTSAGTFGAKNQKAVPSETLSDYKTDVSALALEATVAALNDISTGDVETAVGTALGVYDAATGTDVTTAHSTTDGKIDGLHDFDPTNDKVDIGKVNGNAVTSTSDFKADVSAVALEATVAALNNISTGDVETAVGTALGTYDAATGTDVTTAHSTTDGLIGALNNISVADIYAYVVENSKTFVQIVRLMYSVLVNKVSGGGTTSVVFRDDADSKDRITMTVDTRGNRSAVTKDGT